MDYAPITRTLLAKWPDMDHLDEARTLLNAAQTQAGDTRQQVRQAEAHALIAIAESLRDNTDDLARRLDHHLGQHPTRNRDCIICTVILATTESWHHDTTD